MKLTIRGDLKKTGEKIRYLAQVKTRIYHANCEDRFLLNYNYIINYQAERIPPWIGSLIRQSFLFFSIPGTPCNAGN